VSTIEELLGRKNSGSGLENQEYSLRDPSRLPHDISLSAKVGTNFADKPGGRSVGIVRSQTKATELFSYEQRLRSNFLLIFLPLAHLTAKCLDYLTETRRSKKS
jgi:hypothetical protein